MRVLFAGAPGVGHLFPLVPPALELRSRGHEVAIASMDGGEVVAQCGLPYLPLAPGLDWRTEIREAGRRRRPELLRRVTETNAADREAFVPLAAHVNMAVADAVVDCVGAWTPDLVVYEYLFPAALLGAAKAAIPAVQQDLGFVRTAPLRALMLAEMAGTFDRHGIGSPPEPAAVIDVAPPSLVGGRTYGWSMRPVAYNGEQPLPSPLAAPPSRPRIAVTLGTVPPHGDGLTRIERVVAAAARIDAEFVLATGELDVSTLRNLPPNVRPAGWIPWRALLGTCRGAIHHGGAGTALAALDAAVPQLILPDGSDRFISADAVRERGAGLSASAEEIDAPLLERLITDETLVTAAEEVSAEIGRMPSPADIAARLEELCASTP